MNRIEDLIKQHCPNGIEFILLGQACQIRTGKGITKIQGNEKGIYPIISGGKQPMGYFDSYNRNENTVTISRVGANAGYVSFIDSKFYLNDKCFSILPVGEFQNQLNSKFLYYYLKAIEIKIIELQSEGGVPTINTEKVSKITMPLPPLPIQQEIVKILDLFTELETELEAELEARKTQYTFYRDKLLSFEGKDVEWKTLGEVTKISSGGTPSTKEKSYWENGNIPWLKSEVCKDVYLYEAKTFITELGLKNSSAKYFDQGTVLMAMVGATIFRTAFLTFNATTNQNIAGIKSLDQNVLLDKFLFYFLTNQYSVLTAKLSGYNMINLSEIRHIQIPIPLNSEQDRVVTMLEKFDALVNDISIGLPAELQARRKQYEYYRNKLLSFEPLQKQI